MTTIDVHCHVFGAREIPYERVVRARYENQPLLQPLVEGLLTVIDLYRRGEGPPFERDPRASLRRNPELASALPADLAGVFEAPPQGDPGRSPSALEEPEQPLNPLKLLGWADLITETQGEITRQLLEAYPNIQLFTPLALDMWDRFGGPVERTVDQQLSELARVVVRERGRVHPFVPFDPKEDDEANDRALDRVLDAVLHRGFVGVKLYPSHGFRPWDNADAPGPDGQTLGHERGARYDAALDRLYRACAKHDIPITAHAAAGGVKAYPGAGRNAHPDLWEPVLRRYPLRLNLAHLGGYWHVAARTESWTDAALALMRDHSGVYADLSFQLIFNDSRRGMRRDHAARLRAIAADSQDLGGRLLYGSDWHLGNALRKADRYDRRMREHLAEALGEGFVPRIMGENALDFLGLRAGPARDRLQRFYTQHSIDLPDWWPA